MTVNVRFFLVNVGKRAAAGWDLLLIS